MFALVSVDYVVYCTQENEDCKLILKTVLLMC